MITILQSQYVSASAFTGALGCIGYLIHVKAFSALWKAITTNKIWVGYFALIFIAACHPITEVTQCLR